MPDETYLSIKESATELAVHEDTVRDWLRTGKLKGYKLGGLWKIKREDLDAFIAASSNQPAGAGDRLQGTGDSKDPEAVAA